MESPVPSSRRGEPASTNGHDGSMWGAMVRVYDAGQRLVLERIELTKLEMMSFARVELTEHAARLARTMVLGIAGAVLLVAAWFVLTWGLVGLLAGALPLPLRMLVEGGLNLVAGGALVMVAARRGGGSGGVAP